MEPYIKDNDVLFKNTVHRSNQHLYSADQASGEALNNNMNEGYLDE